MDIWLPPKPAIIRPASCLRPALARPRNLPLELAPFGIIAGFRAAGFGFANVSFNDFASIASSGTTFDFGVRNLGPANGLSQVLVMAACFKVDGATAITVASSTIGGASFDNSLTAQSGLVSLSVTAAHLRKTTSANSANITIVTNVTCNNVRIAVFRLNNLTSITPDDTVTANNNTTSTSGVIDTVNPGILLLCSAASSATINTLSGVATMDVATGNPFSAGHSQQLATQSNRAVSSTSSTANPHALVGQTWH
jgi:hypothetical protein